MKDHWKISGKIVSGVKQGAFFTQLDWVQEQCLEKLGFKPFPGTLNLEIAEENMAIVEALLTEENIELVPPDSHFCSGFVFPVTVEDNPGAMEGQLSSENRKLTVDAVMFDLDGTLIDTVPIYYEILDIVFTELEVPAVTRQTLMEAMNDGEFDWNCVLPEHMKSQKVELTAKARKIVDEIAPKMFHKQIKLIPGTDEIFRKIAIAGIKVGLVTSTPAQMMAVKMIPLSNSGLDKQFEAIVTADDVRHKKPAAEPLIQCGQKLEVSFNKCVYVGDTRVDIRSGKAAGMKTVGVLTGFDDYDALKKEMPDAIIDSIVQLNETLMIHPAREW